MRPLFCLAFASLALGFAPAPIPKPVRIESDPNKADMARLQGTWYLIRCRIDCDTEEGEFESALTRIVVSGNRVTLYRRSEEAEDRMIRLNARANPRRLTLRRPDDGKNFEYVYAVEDSFLTWGVSIEPDKPPTALCPGPDTAVFVFRRTKP